MSAGAWLAPLLRRLAPWLALAVMALACRHYALLAATRAKALADQAAAFHAAQDQAQIAARAALAHAESRYRWLARNNEVLHDVRLETARAAAARYAGTHRVQPAPAAGAGGHAEPTAPDNLAGVRESLPAAGIVVSRDDVQACTEVTAYALSLRDWALDIGTAPKRAPASAPGADAAR